MRIAEISINRPIFMSSVLVGVLVLGSVFYNRLPVDIFPDVSFPVVTVTTVYPGAGPTEVENLVSKPLEEELSTLSGVKSISSINRESASTVVAEFTLETDVKFAEQQVRDRVSASKSKLPRDVEEPMIRRIDPADQPIMIVGVEAPLSAAELYNLANEEIRPRLEQVTQVGRVELVGGRKREIQVQLDRKRLQDRDIPVLAVASSLNNAGQNIPAGKISQTESDIVFRTIGEFSTVEKIQKQVVRFVGNDVTTTIGDVGQVVDTLQDEKTRAFVSGQPSLLLNIYKQSGANTIQVSEGIKKRLTKLEEELKLRPQGDKYQVRVVRDTSKIVRANVADVQESILIGIALTILVVYLFLGSLRSTVITGLAIPFSLIGGMALIYWAGFSINVMTLLALSLAVGLLIDDAIVVRENIFRHLEMGKSPQQAALDGTKEVGLAVIAVTLAILAVFGPIAFLDGVVGQFFKSFGLTVCFVMAVSLFDALSNAPMLSAYFGGRFHKPTSGLLLAFDRFQTWLEDLYVKSLDFTLHRRGLTLAGTFVVVVLLALSIRWIPKTFLPAQNNGEFLVSIQKPVGTSLAKTSEFAQMIEKSLRENPEIVSTIMTVGNSQNESHKTDIFVNLKPFKEREHSTNFVKEQVRSKMKEFTQIAGGAQIVVKDIDIVAAGMRPFNIYVRGDDLNQVRTVANQMFEKMKTHPAVADPEISDKPGIPEFQVKVDPARAELFGVTASTIGAELRGQVEGLLPAKFREKGLEYDVRVRMAEEQRDLEKHYSEIKVPNVNGTMVALRQFSEGKREQGLATINRDNRSRYISIGSDIRPEGPGLGGLMNDVNSWVSKGEIVLPPGVTYRFVGQAENFQELVSSMLMAAVLALIFIFLVLASLYESTVTPFTIMLVIPFAIFGGFFGLLVMQSTLDLFSMIGCIMLMGLATKNSIILVDYIVQRQSTGLDLNSAIREACRARLRPILMTSLALMAGMLPVAIGLNEASSQRTSLGIAVIGGVLISTLLTLVVIPSVYGYIEGFRQWMISRVGKKMISQ